MAYLRSGRSVIYVPSQTLVREGKSKIKPTRDGILFLLIISKVATLFSPLRVFLPISAFLFVTGIFSIYFYGAG